MIRISKMIFGFLVVEHVLSFFLCRKSVDAAGREVWLTNGTYWKLRENPGFTNMKTLELW